MFLHILRQSGLLRLVFKANFVLYIAVMFDSLVDSEFVLNESHELEEELDTGTKVLYIMIATFLVCMAGLASGLTLGLLSLDHIDLEVCSALHFLYENIC